MAIRKVKGLESDFTIVPNKTINDNLSWEARGLLLYLCSKPDDWTVSVAHLVNQTSGCEKSSGRDAVRRIMKELVNRGYMRKSQCRTGGKFDKNDYEVSFLPFTENPSTVKPSTVEPSTANPPLQSKEISQSKEVKKTYEQNDLLEDGFNIFYSAGLVKKSKQQAFKKFCLLVKKSKADPIVIGETLANDVKQRIAANQFGIDKLHPSTYLNNSRWEDSIEQRQITPAADNSYDAVYERMCAENFERYGAEFDFNLD